jgi:hypothetical protein
VHATPTTPISSAASHHDAVVRDGLADHVSAPVIKGAILAGVGRSQ